jgi:type IV pilus assembly protein PilM
MPFWNSLTRLVKDPPPSFVFELSEEGLAYSHGGHAGFEPFAPGDMLASPVEDNILKPETIVKAIAKASPANGSKRRPAALLLPDAAARVSVLDFDSFPDTPEDQLALVRFRVKKTVPFEIESAAVSYFVQPGSNREGKKEVVAATVALDVLARYEALFRAAGFHTGDVTVSALAALNLYKAATDEVAMIAKLAGGSLTVMVVAGGKLKLFRCLALEVADEAEILSVLRPTFAYAEDELGSPVRRLMLCGFDRVPSGLPAQVETLQGRLGQPHSYNAGLMGYLEGI